MKRRRRDVFDEPTTPYESGGVPVPVDDEDDDTRPIDAEELESAVRRSKEEEEPGAPTASLPVARTAANALPRPYVELVVAGARTGHRLPVHRVSPMGVVLTVPLGFPVELATDTPVTAVVHLMRDGAPHTRAQIPAHVSHHRMATDSAVGGLSLRWDLREASARSAVDALLADAN